MSPHKSQLVACGGAVVVAAARSVADANDVVDTIGVVAADDVVVVVGDAAADDVWV